MDQSLFKYEIVAEDPKTHARAGILHTPPAPCNFSRLLYYRAPCTAPFSGK